MSPLSPASSSLETVTFVFTDIEGSTLLLRQLGDDYAKVLGAHRQIIRATFDRWEGEEVDTQGDSFFYAFRSARKAVAAAVDVQQELAEQDWPQDAKMLVRIGLHTGEPIEKTEEGYVGLDVHRAARIADASHGGQILLSPTTFALVEMDLPAGITARHLGDFLLKDIQRPILISELTIDGLTREFPPLKASPVRRHNVPASLGEFVGRERETNQLLQRLSLPDHRLVTITGPGGTGKTRLALEVVGRLAAEFPDGAWFVDLSPLSDPSLVPSAIAGVLEVRERGGLSALDTLKDALAEREMVLLLDNFEHLMDAAQVVSDLLSASSGLKCLITSRELLQVYGEFEFPLAPLSLPDKQLKNPSRLIETSEAVQLFQARARAVAPDFELSPTNAQYVAGICYRVDGLPLAIELAAARIRLFSPKALLEHLEDRLGTLTGGPRDAPARQRTLRATLEWSHDLLAPSEQILFRQIGIFTGGFDLESLEAVSAEWDSGRGLDDLQSLITKSLVYRDAGDNPEDRYRLLETIREYALEQLQSSEDHEDVALRHARYFAGFAEDAARELTGPTTIAWISRLESDHDNLRSAVHWAMQSHDHCEIALRIAGSLAQFWALRGYLQEGYSIAVGALQQAGAEADTVLRAQANLGAARLAYRQNHLQAAEQHYAQTLELSRSIGAGKWIAECLVGLGMVDSERGEYSTVDERFSEALSIFESIGDPHGTANAIINLAWSAMRTGNYETAERYLLQSLDLSKSIGDKAGLGFSLSGLGEAYLRMQKLEMASKHLEESLEIRSSLGDKWGMGATLGTLGWVAIRQEAWDQAKQTLEQSLSLRQELGDLGGAAWCLEKLAEVMMATDRPIAAVKLYGAASSIRDRIGSSIDPADQEDYQKKKLELQKRIGADAFLNAWAQGEELEAAVVADLASKEPPTH
ncbi:MAG: tetratricopeptide repeat protein [Anaerolineales bacterium]